MLQENINGEQWSGSASGLLDAGDEGNQNLGGGGHSWLPVLCSWRQDSALSFGKDTDLSETQLPGHMGFHILKQKHVCTKGMDWKWHILTQKCSRNSLIFTFLVLKLHNSLSPSGSTLCPPTLSSCPLVAGPRLSGQKRGCLWQTPFAL